MQSTSSPSDMAEPGTPCVQGRAPCHLRRIGIRPPDPDLADVIHFWKTITLIGKNREVVDCFLSYAAAIGNYISRIHARVIQTGDTYELVDSSLRGVYVNDVRISDKVVLQEGDTVTFGHPDGKGIPPGARVRQPNSPFYFLFERCHCNSHRRRSLGEERRLTSQELPVLASAKASLLSPLTVGFRNNIIPPLMVQAPSVVLPTRTPETCCRRSCPHLATAMLTLPLTSTASALSPVPPSLDAGSWDATSGAPGMARWKSISAGPFLPPGAAEGPATPQLLPSASPEYPVLGEGSLVAPRPSPSQRTPLEKLPALLLPGDPQLSDSESLNGSSELETGGRGGPGSDKQFPQEESKCSPGIGFPGVAGPADNHPMFSPPPPASAWMEEPAAGGCDGEDSQSENPIDAAGVPEGLSQVTEDSDSPGSSFCASNQDALVPDSPGQQELSLLERTLSRRPEETPQYQPPCEKPNVPEGQGIGEARGTVNGSEEEEGTSLGKRGEESPREEGEWSFRERALRQASCGPGMEEEVVTEGAEESLLVEVGTSHSSKPGSPQNGGLSRMDSSPIKQPESWSFPGLVKQETSDPGQVCAFSPAKDGLPKGGDTKGGMNSQESASDGEDEMEIEPHQETCLLATGSNTGTKGCHEPGMMASWNRGSAGIRFAEVEILAACRKGSRLDLRTSESAKGDDAKGKLDGVDCDGMLNTAMALAGLSPMAFPVEEHFLRKGDEGSHGSSGGLSEPSRHESPLPAAPMLAVPLTWGTMHSERPPEVVVPEQPAASEEGCLCGYLTHNRQMAIGDEGKETTDVGRRLECLSPGWAKTGRGQDSDDDDDDDDDDDVPDAGKGAHEDDGCLLGTNSMLVVGSPEEQPSRGSGRENCREEMMEKEPLPGRGEEYSEEETGECSRAATATSKQRTGKGAWREGEGGAWSPLAEQEGAACASAGAEDPLPGCCFGENATWPSEGMASRKAKQLLPFRVPGGDFGEAGGKLGPESSCLLNPHEDEGAAHDVERVPGVAREGDGRRSAEGVLGQAAVGSKGNHSGMGLLDGFHRHLRNSPCSSTHETSLLVDPLEPEYDSPESEGLEGHLTIDAQGNKVAEQRLCLEASLVEVCLSEEDQEPERAVDCLNPLRPPEQRHEKIAFQEEDSGLGQAPEKPPWEVEQGGLLVDTPGAALLGEPGAAEESGAWNHSGEPQNDSAKTAGFCSSGNLNLCISGLEAGKEDAPHRESVQRASALGQGMEGGVTAENLTEGSTTQVAHETVTQGSSAGAQEGKQGLDVGLIQKNNDEPHHDRGEDVTFAEAQTHSLEVAVGEKLSPVRSGLMGDVENQYMERREFMAEPLPDPTGESPSLAKTCSVKEQDRPATAQELLPENIEQETEQDHWRLLGGRSSRQRAVGSGLPLETGGRDEELWESEISTGLWSGEEGNDQKMEGQDVQCYGSQGRCEADADSSSVDPEEADCWDCPGWSLQEAGKLEGSCSRKRGQEGPRISDLEEGSSGCPKRPCLQDPLPGQGLASPLATPSASSPLVCRDPGQLGRTEGRFLNLYGSHVTLGLDRTGEQKRERVAQMVRNYFKNALCSNEKPEPVLEEAAKLALPLGAGATTTQETEGGLSGGKQEVTEEASRDKDQTDGIQFQAASLGGQPGGPQGGKEEDEDLESQTPGSIWEAYFSEEEAFQTRVCSALDNSMPGSPPIKSPGAKSVQESNGEDPGSCFSEVPSSSAEAAFGGNPHPCKQEDGRSASEGGDVGSLLGGGPSEETPEVGLPPGSSCGASRTPLGATASSQESSWPLPGEARPEHECHGSIAPVECDAFCLQPGGDVVVDEASRGSEASSKEGPEEPPHRNAIEGEEEEDKEEEEGTSQGTRQPEERHFPWRKATGSPCQEMGGEFPRGQLCAILPWQSSSLFPARRAEANGHFHMELKREPLCQEEEPQRRPPSPCSQISRTPASEGPLSPPASSSLVGDGEQEDSPPESSSASSLSLGKANAWPGPPGSPFLLTSSAERDDRHVKGEEGGAEERLQRTERGPCSLPPPPVPDMHGGSATMALAAAPSVLPLLKEEEEEDSCGSSKDQLASRSSGPSSPMAGVVPVITTSPEPFTPEPFSARRPGCSSVSPVGKRTRPLLEGQPEEDEATWPLAPVGFGVKYVAGPSSLGPEPGVFSPHNDHPCGSSPQSQRDSWPTTEGAAPATQHAWATSERDVEFQLQECQSVLAEISRALGEAEGIDSIHVEKWRDQVATLQRATKMPQTYIAVVGNTGAGKSCLLNALLDEEGLLPTSAMRACTAVVVEVSRAAGGSPYEAQVEFLSCQEWSKELKALLEDMKDKSGHLKRRCPDRKTEAGAAYCRMKAVYGRIDELENLEGIQEVTQHLGTTKHISAETACAFRTEIEKYIDSRTDSLREMKGGEFWPIVKCVRIRVASSEVLKTGAVLVDLPGLRDSNAARDSAAKEYLKDCNAVWIVASITRAVDDKTAKEMLGASQRRQLLMDGQYGSLAFVCTKADSFNITDIVRDLNLQGEIQPIEDELRELESQRMRAEAGKKSLYEHLRQEEQQHPDSFQRQHEILEKEFQISDLQRQKEAKLRAISLVCVQARNKFSKKQILIDFKAGLEEMKRKAVGPGSEEESEEELELEEDRDPNPGCSHSAGPGEITSQQLQVFTVSSTEYLKLCGKLLRDGQPQVFHDTKDTEIPALKKFAMDTALKHSMVATEKIIRDVACLLSQMVNFLTSQRAEDCSHQAQIQETVLGALRDVLPLLQEPIEHSLSEIQHCFGVLIHGSLSKGAAEAKELCEAVVKSWGSPPYPLPHATYRAACCRHGVYSSPSLKNQHVDFNKSLAEPILRAVAVTWHHVFSVRLDLSIQGFGNGLFEMLKSFFKNLERKLSQQSRIVEAIHTVYRQQMEEARARLLSFIFELKDYITHEQRKISRLLTPEIKARMEPAYAACGQMRGKGYFEQMKARMESHIHQEKEAIFDSAIEKLQEQLARLEQKIQARLQSFVQELSRSLEMQLEAVLKPVQKNVKVIPELMNICSKMDKICRRSCVDYILPSPMLAEDAGSLRMEREPWGDRGPNRVMELQEPSNHDAKKETSLPHLPEVIQARQQAMLPPGIWQGCSPKRAREDVSWPLRKKHKGGTLGRI